MAAPRRTQSERRAATRERLVDAMIATLAEHGYAAATTQRVLDEAKVSVGGMYRHFPTRMDLVVAAAETLRERQFDAFTVGLEAIGTRPEVECIQLLRAACRRRDNGAWYDLLVAARSDGDLRARLAPFTQSYHARILELARSLPVAERWGPGAFAAAVFSVIHMLDGEAIAAVVHPQPELEELRTELMAAILRGEAAPPGLRGSA